jgi:hypothetical protein
MVEFQMGRGAFIGICDWIAIAAKASAPATLNA